MERIQSFAEDFVELMQRKHRSEPIDRRTFLAGCAFVGAAQALFAARRADAAKEIVMINWGGDNSKWIDQVYLKPYEKETGTKFVVDTSGPTAGKLRTIAESGKITWDVADSVPHTAFQLGKLGYLDEIDYAIVDRGKVLPAFVYKWAVGNGTFSNVLTYDTEKFKGRPPTSWADFWNLKEFPGKRALWKGFNGVLEVALMGDGVPMDKLYPLDTKRALEKIKQIKEHTIFWTSGSESVKLLREAEVAMASVWSTRALGVKDDTKGRIDFSFNQGVMVPGVWLVPKGNPAGKDVYRFIASTQKPERQVEMLIGYGYGTVNPAAAPLVPAQYRPRDPAHPDNLKRQVLIRSEWYAEHYDTVFPMYIDAISA